MIMTVSASMRTTATTPPMMTAVSEHVELTLSARLASVTGGTKKAMKSLNILCLLTSRDKDRVAVSGASYIASSDCEHNTRAQGQLKGSFLPFTP